MKRTTWAFVAAGAWLGSITMPAGGGPTPQPWIAFDRYTDAPHITLIKPGGSEEFQLTDEVESSDPSWSPDGTKLVFNALNHRRRRVELYTIDVDGNGLKRIRGGRRDRRSYLEPVWSPAGDKIAITFRTSAEDPNVDIGIVNSDGTGFKRLTNSPRWGIFDHSFSPNGERIVFGACRDGCEIRSVPTGGGRVKTLVDKKDSFGPEYSPDGSRIVYMHLIRRAAPDQYNVFTMKPDGTGKRRLTRFKGLEIDPHWSPDGTRIMFRRFTRGRRRDNLFVMDKNGDNVRRLTRSKGDFDAAWSPDGTQIAFMTLRHNWPPQLYVMNADGTGETRINNSNDDVFDQGEPVWQPVATP